MPTMTLADLERHLWGAADLLRGSIDSGDFKHYIFGLLFYRRLCDVWVEEYEARLAEYADDALARDPEEHRFHIPGLRQEVCKRGQAAFPLADGGMGMTSLPSLNSRPA